MPESVVEAIAMNGTLPAHLFGSSNLQQRIAGGADRKEQLRIGVAAYRLGSPRVVGIGKCQAGRKNGHVRLHGGEL